MIFDCFGVLYGGAFQTLLDLAPEDMRSAISDAHHAKDRGDVTYDEFVANIADIIGKSPIEVAKIIEKRQVLNQELVDFARSLKPDYEVALLSNIDEGTYGQLFGGWADTLFDAVVLSSREPITKPDSRIFRLTADRLGLLPEQCIMVDDLEPNCLSARGVGMEAIVHTKNTITIREITDLISGV